MTTNIHRRFLGELADPSSKQAALVKNLTEFYAEEGGDAAPQFQSKLREFSRDPESHVGFIDEVTLAELLVSHRIPHRFIPETRRPTPDIEATICGKRIYFEVKAVQEDRYMWLIRQVLEQVGVPPSGVRLVVNPVHVGNVDTASLVATVAQKIKAKLALGDFSPVQHQDRDAKIYVLIQAGAQSLAGPWRSTWPESRRACGVPFLDWKLEQTLTGNIGQFRSYRPTLLVWYMWDQSLWDSETQSHFRHSVPNLLSKRELADVAGIVIGAPGWFVFESASYRGYHDLKSVGVFDAIRALA